jgi:hypothetical protein
MTTKQRMLIWGLIGGVTAMLTVYSADLARADQPKPPPPPPPVAAPAPMPATPTDPVPLRPAPDPFAVDEISGKAAEQVGMLQQALGQAQEEVIRLKRAAVSCPPQAPPQSPK